MTFYAPRDKIDQVEYAKENAVIMLDYMEEYFNITYPLPKAGKRSCVIKLYSLDIRYTGSAQLLVCSYFAFRFIRYIGRPYHGRNREA